MSEEAILDLLVENSTYFSPSHIFISAFRIVGWWIVKGLIFLANCCQDFYEACFRFLDFTEYEPVKNFLSEFKVGVVVILTISFVIIGYKLLFSTNKKPTVITNFMIGMFVLCASATLLNTLNTAMFSANAYITDSYGENGNAANQVVSSCLTDLIYIDKQIGLENMNPENLPHEQLGDEVLNNLNFIEVVKEDNKYLTTDNAKNILQKKAVYVPGNTYVLDNIYNGVLMTDFASEYYYRYHLDFFSSVLILLSLVITFAVLGYKVIKLIWEIITGQFLVILFSGEIVSGQTIKKILECLRNTYVVMLYTMVSIKLYLLAVDYIMANFTGVIRGGIILCLAFAIIDGPVMIEKILGLDAGLQSGTAKILAMAHLMSSGARNTMNMVQSHRMNQSMRDMRNAMTTESHSQSELNDQMRGEMNNQARSEQRSNFNTDNTPNTENQSENNTNFTNENGVDSENVPNGEETNEFSAMYSDMPGDYITPNATEERDGDITSSMDAELKSESVGAPHNEQNSNLQEFQQNENPNASIEMPKENIFESTADTNLEDRNGSLSDIYNLSGTGGEFQEQLGENQKGSGNFKYNVDANLYQSVDSGVEKQSAKDNTISSDRNMSYQNENRSNKNDMKMEKGKLNKE